MADAPDHTPLRRALVTAAGDFYARGWMAGTAGNLSAREATDTEGFWITASGRPKGRMDDGELLRVALHGEAVLEAPTPGLRPSAETAIHRVLYRLFPDVRAVFHTHTVEACLAAEFSYEGAETLRLPPLEMIKGFGVWEQEPRVDLPLFDNLLDVPAVAQAIEARFTAHPPRLPALLIHGHGVTVWGDSWQQAYHHVELMEFILRYMVLHKAIKR